MSSVLAQLKARELIHDVSQEDELEKALSAGPVSFYCGFDPTADSLHVGSMLPLIIMRRLQQAGHTPIVVLGTGTGLVGDPSGKSAERPVLTAEQIAKNTAGIQAQVGLFLETTGKNAAELISNDSWLKELSYLEFLRDVGKHFSVNAMIVKESVRSRLEDREHGISYTEFSYMLLQAYDFYWLYKNKNCRLQVGGSDQWGNITAGLELIRRKSAAEGSSQSTPQAFGATFPLLMTASGAKFGKTEEGNVWLDPQKTPPYRFYQYWFNTQDADVIRYLSYFTEVSDEELDAFRESTKTAPQKREAQAYLATTLTTLVHGAKHTARAQTASKILFGEKIADIDEATLVDIFKDVPSTEIPKSTLSAGINILELLTTCGLTKSKGEARRLLKGGGVYLNNLRIDDPELNVTTEHLATSSKLVLRSGKKRYHLVSVS